MKTRGRSTVGPLLRWPGSVLATLDALAVATARFTSLINSAMLQDLVIASAALLGFLFLWMLFDPGVRFAIDAANAEMKGGNSNAAYFRWRRIPLLDPTWGLFGSRTGGFFLAGIRIVLVGEFVLEALLSGGSSGHGVPPSGLLLSVLGLALTIRVALIGLKEHYPRAAAISAI